MIKRALVIVACVGCAAFLGWSQNAPDDDVIMRAMRDELDRSRQLRVVGGGDDVPYFISYQITDAEGFQVSASMGAVVGQGRHRYRVPDIEVRVGSYDFDHTGHLYSGIYTGSRFDGSWPLDDNYPNLRDALWLATDRAYKAALESMARKRAALNGANAPAEKLADFSQVEPVKNVAKVVRKKIDEAGWTARTANLSAIFNSYPEVLSSGVSFQAIEGYTYLMNNEGTTLRYPDSVATIETSVEGQAPDGMILHDFAGFQQPDVDLLPSEADVAKVLTGVAQEMQALVKAPLGEGFSGPTLFEPRAAAQLLAQLIGENVVVTRKPLAEPGRAVNFLPSEFETKLGSRILPEYFNITDDPTQSAWNGQPLAGHDVFDLEGVPDKPVSLVEKGVLKGFLTTRQPVKGAAGSNGHARLSGSYGARGAAISNLMVSVTESTPLADLKKKLIDMAKQRGKPYGMLVRKLDYPYSGGIAGLRSLYSGAGGSSQPVSPPLLVYRVYPDGHEELVRGLRFRGVSTRALRDVLGASKETALFDYVNNSSPMAMVDAGGYLAPTAVVAPGLLFDEIEFERPQEQLPKPPLVPAPTGGQ
jgi:TldD protein